MVSKENKKTIIEMRKANKSYDYIASQLGLTKSAVQNVCRQAGLAGKKAKQRKRCKQCGALLPEDAPKRKIFCCQKCREDWWNKHQHLVHKRNPVITYCKTCGNPIENHKSYQKQYCNSHCFHMGKFGRDKAVNLK